MLEMRFELCVCYSAEFVVRPPLANQLFDTRPIFVEAMRRFKDCMAIVPYLRKAGISVEQELAKLQAQAEKFPHVHREIAAVHYYLHTALAECQKEWRKHHHGTTNYATFLREIERWRSEFKETVCLWTSSKTLKKTTELAMNLQARDFIRSKMKTIFQLTSTLRSGELETFIIPSLASGWVH